LRCEGKKRCDKIIYAEIAIRRRVGWKNKEQRKKQRMCMIKCDKKLERIVRNYESEEDKLR
jgi:hypothetical protein